MHFKYFQIEYRYKINNNIKIKSTIQSICWRSIDKSLVLRYDSKTDSLICWGSHNFGAAPAKAWSFLIWAHPLKIETEDEKNYTVIFCWIACNFDYCTHWQ